MYVYFLILGKPLAYGSAESLRFLPESMQIALRETARIRFGKAGAHPQLAWETAIAPETLCLITTFLFLKAIAVSAILS